MDNRTSVDSQFKVIKMSEEKKLSLEYITNSVEVSSTSSLELDVEKELGSIANRGWITSDDGSILIQINGQEKQKIPLVSGDTLNFEKEDDWRIKSVKITTTSASSLTIRYMLRRKEEITP